MLFLLSKVAVWLVFWTLRYTPIVGVKLSDAYGERVFSPVADDIEVTSVGAADPEGHEGTELRFTVVNDSWVDIDVDGLDVRIGRSEDGATVRNISWAPAFDAPPKNVGPTRVPAGGEGTVTVEFLEPAVGRGPDTVGATDRDAAEVSANDAADTDAADAVDAAADGGAAELCVDGSFVFEYSFQLRGHRFSFGDRSHDLPATTVTR